MYSVAFSPDGQYLASGSTDGAVRVWDVTTQSLAASLKGHEEVSFNQCGTILFDRSFQEVRSVAFSPNTSRDLCIASGSDDTTVILWDTGALPKWRRSKFQMFCLAKHRRSGAGSEASRIVEDLMGMIHGYVMGSILTRT